MGLLARKDLPEMRERKRQIIAKALRGHMKSEGINQKELAEALKVSPASISSWVNGGFDFSVQAVGKINDLIGELGLHERETFSVNFGNGSSDTASFCMTSDMGIQDISYFLGGDRTTRETFLETVELWRNGRAYPWETECQNDLDDIQNKFNEVAAL